MFVQISPACGPNPYVLPLTVASADIEGCTPPKTSRPAVRCKLAAFAI